MNKSKKIIIATTLGIAFLVLLVAAIVYLSINNNSTTTADETEQQLFTSMEGGDAITQEDADIRQQTESFAREQITEYLKEEFPTHQTILVKTIEWYFTDENESDNILVRAEVVSSDGTRTEEMNVIEIGRTGDTLTKKQLYNPDER